VNWSLRVCVVEGNALVILVEVGVVTNGGRSGRWWEWMVAVVVVVSVAYQVIE
jgi:hypothetical protein